MFDLKNTVNRIEVVNDSEDGYWTAGSIELFDEDGGRCFDCIAL